MNKAAFIALFSLIVFKASSQRIYFIYLQNESQQAFFVKLDEKIHSSSATGYLILSRLKDSVYSFTVGFPGNMAAEQKFTCSINKKDHGFLLKNFGEKGWGLLDLQTLSIQMAVNDSKKDVSIVNGPVNAFTDLLAKAADDSTLRQKIVLQEKKEAEPAAQVTVKKEQPELPASNKAETRIVNADSLQRVNAVVPASTVIKKKEDIRETPANSLEHKTTPPETAKIQASVPPAVNPGAKKTADTIAKADEKKVEKTILQVPSNDSNRSYVRSKVARKSESTSAEGLGIIFIDSYADGNQDTIRILVPNESAIKFTDVVTKDTAVKKESPETIKANSGQNSGTTATGKTVLKNNCRVTATDADFYKLRKKMVSEKSDGDMLDEARKSFKAKCFTTIQVKSLAALFLGDGGKYYFFDAAHLHISDTENFASLQDELKDEYFINRFKAMLR